MILRSFIPFLLTLASSSPADAGVSFERDVLPVLTRAGCNSGACHGNLNGKGGFKLSLKGEDPATDYASLTREMLARRTDPHCPAESLILKKAVGEVPHEGGARFSVRSTEYAVLRDWVAAGAGFDPPNGPSLTRLIVTPLSRILIDPADRFTVSVTAHFSDGSVRDVTLLSAFEFTVVGIARITPQGEVVRENVGETVLLVRYLSEVVPVRIVFLPDRPIPEMGTLQPNNEIDRLVFTHLKQLRLKPAELAPDHVFLRRAYLDTLGVLPSAAEAREFLADTSPGKRERLIDRLLERPEFAEYWAQKWSDLLRNEEKALDRKGVSVFYRWIAAQIAVDRPLNEFARDILSATGSTYANPPANFWRAVREPTQRAEAVAQVFLGIRIGCARCHNHPFDRWTIDEYYGFSALFARIDYRVEGNDRRDRLDKHEFIGEQFVFQHREGEVQNPRTKKPAKPVFLGAKTPNFGRESDRLTATADWIASPTNPFFARAQVNRIWLHLMGRGLVDPNDDFRATNPPTNPELMEYLARDFAAGGFRLKRTVRQIMTSRVYQLASTVREATTMGDELHHSHAAVMPLEAEQLLDALAQVTEVSVRFSGYPVGLRANQVPAPPQSGRRFDGMGEKFLKVFGKPDRLLTCECERLDDPGLLQAFQLITGELMNSLVRDPNNRVGKMLSAGKTDAEILEETYLAALSRPPTETESKRIGAFLAGAKDRRVAWEDVLWAILNSKEFLLRR
jgi:hypothetical protein